MKAGCSGEGFYISREFVKSKVAKETALLLYLGLEKEYRQAKMKAAKNCGTRVLPTNLDVALELDEIAETNEGAARKERLVAMRHDALRILKLLKTYNPILIGSVWRGTIRKGSDIDIAIYTDAPEEVLPALKNQNLRVSKKEWVTVTKRGQPEVSFHIHVTSSKGHEVEIVAREVAKMTEKRKCDVFGDLLKGLTIRELEKILKQNPSQKFVPC